MPSSIAIPKNYLEKVNNEYKLVDVVKDYIKDLYKFINNYKSVWNWHVVDFYMKDCWYDEKIFPTEWRLLKDCTLDEILRMTSLHEVKEEWPESLKNYIHLTKEISLIRNPELINLDNHFTIEDINKNILIGMNPKKIYEVKILAALINKVAKSNHINNILDIGAGQAYLSSVLAYQHNLRVLGVDCDQIQICGASTRNEYIKRALAFNSKKNENDGNYNDENYSTNENENENENKSDSNEKEKQIGKLYMCNRLVTENDTFASLIEEITKHEEIIDPKESWLTCGLHACGDLTPSMIKLFLKGNSNAFVGIGCCYNLLTEEDHDNNEKGFPLSEFSNENGFQLGPAAKMIACQVTPKWITQKSSIGETFKKHFYRALLQVIIFENHLLPEEEEVENHIVIGRMRKQHMKSFKAYATEALQRLHVPIEKIESLPFESYVEKYQHRQGEIIAAWALRTLISNAIESLILTDRWLFFQEQSRILQESTQNQCIDTHLFPLFDQVTSPRNMVFIAIKKTQAKKPKNF
ncbi:hypothetical protein LY90DRAFT_671192 [Neocallimastix californiae]|uniref:Methyltransferase domain-containing protein n=1 Tax=Neocallimastix californiae TaxID=1754190 RepID=A0A1Y2CKL4_9FUNG|nr:hypothetical protein LY90DRAFT_671192 [Neocallimastix californiae]|eukprot:ORY47559.1 hypothetical protein LY90DRAFT_671192 [Neocallimastix californiae]